MLLNVVTHNHVLLDVAAFYCKLLHVLNIVACCCIIVSCCCILLYVVTFR